LFGDNQAEVNNSAIIHSCLSKQNNAPFHHRVCEAIAVKVVNFFWVNGKDNPADIVSKHWDSLQIWYMIQLILFYSGVTKKLSKEKNISKSQSLVKIAMREGKKMEKGKCKKKV
jgi:hypothetical protein